MAPYSKLLKPEPPYSFIVPPFILSFYNLGIIQKDISDFS
jgi:hypothetical protein